MLIITDFFTGQVFYRSLFLILMVLPRMQTENWITAEGFREYCETEIFRAKCEPGHVVLMENARYGRMRIGRCLDRDYGYVGCSKDVLGIADKWCSGRQSCEVPIPNSAFRSTNPCPKDLKPYFEAGYRCLKVEDGGGQNCEQSGIVKVTSDEGYLSKMMAVEKGYGTADCPWFIETGPGQKLNVTLLDFSLAAWEYNMAVNDGICRVTAIIREKGETSGVTVCGGEGRHKNVYTSTTNALEIRILGLSDTNKGYFLLHFHTIGCPDPEVPKDAHIKRRGDIAQVECQNNNRKWKLTCKGREWIGDQWNCSSEVIDMAGNVIGDVVFGGMLMPFEVSIVIIVAIALAIGIIILSLGLVCLRWRLNIARAKHNNKGAIPAQNTAYDEKRPRDTTSQDSYPPPPYPGIPNGEDMNITENEYAYISDVPLTSMNGPNNGPSMGLHSSPAIGGSPLNGPTNVRHPSQSSHDSPRFGGQPHHGGGAFNSPKSNSRGSRPISDPRAPEFEMSKHTSAYPTGGYEQAVSNGPINIPNGGNIPVAKPRSKQITPKLLAHECALAVKGSNPPPFVQGQKVKVKIRSPRSRYPSNGSDTPTYFELDPEANTYNLMPKGAENNGTLPSSSPKQYRANNALVTFKSDRQNSNGKNTTL